MGAPPVTDRTAPVIERGASVGEPGCEGVRANDAVDLVAEASDVSTYISRTNDGGGRASLILQGLRNRDHRLVWMVQVADNRPSRVITYGWYYVDICTGAVMRDVF